jgi:hypothetical protein
MKCDVFIFNREDSSGTAEIVSAILMSKGLDACSLEIPL